MYTRPKSTRAKLCFSIKKQQYLLYICYILLLQASDIELNPGPNTTTFPCNICGNEVDWDQKAVACDNCSDWYHTSCMHINSYHYNVLQKSNISWIYNNCGIPNFSSSIFESVEVTTSSSFQDISNEDLLMNSDRSEFPLHCSSPLKSAPIKKLDNKLRSVCLNIQSIKSKREAIWNFHDSSNPDILFDCETWVNPNITDNEILPENTGYNIFRKDRNDGYGGVMLAIKAEIVSEQVDVDTPCECIARKINRNTRDSLIVATIYRPTNNDVDYAKALYNTIKSLCLNYPKSTIWVAGDFNLPDIDWLTNTFSGNRYLNEINQKLLQIEELELSQIVKFPTRDKSTLELFFANRPSLLNQCEPIPGISDHDTAVYIDSDISIKRQRPT